MVGITEMPKLCCHRNCLLKRVEFGNRQILYPLKIYCYAPLTSNHWRHSNTGDTQIHVSPGSTMVYMMGEYGMSSRHSTETFSYRTLYLWTYDEHRLV